MQIGVYTSMEINIKKNGFEIRTAHDMKGNERYELAKWEKTEDGRDYSFVLAYFHKDSNGYYNLIFVGDRPFQYIAEIDIADIWRELWMAQMMLNGDKQEE